ncbi:class I adenylate-forming enzyme family protein [Mycolicibacterium helvum]|uniref:AMP-binding protein n=1 Tax=Mycolicibacterium helvum TaxID=1534349 RepID=A0A7I7T8U4_9MYCO|nr:class I adenylate-forming enzyme family protein [Mycolicibacterium helvum]BBY64735.1 AMP-binding protein [Mycolicibacterium helvum]
MNADTVGALLREQAAARGDHPLLVCDAERLSYAEAEQHSAELARGLIALSAGKGTHIGLLYPNGAAFVIAMLAAARIGAVVVPFSTFSTEPELRDQLVHSDTEILLATPSFRGHDYATRLSRVTAPWLRHVAFGHQIADACAPELAAALEDDVDGCDPLTIVYTSGSTGTPKGVVHTHESLLDHQRNLNEIRGLTPGDRLFCNSPFFWIGGLAFGLLATLVAGSTLVCSNGEPGAVLDLLEEVQPTMTNGFAAGAAYLARHESFAGRDLSSMRRGNLYPIMAPDARPCDPELRHNILGMTEAGSVLLLSGDDTDQPEHRRGSFGKPAPGFDAQIVDGELYIRGRYVMQQYYKRSREECFDADGWFHTGDLFRTDADGFFYFLGRRGSMIKTAGANVLPAEVEKAIAHVTGGLVAHVLPLPDPGRGQLVAAVVLVADSETFDEDAVRDRLRTELSSYKIPRRFATLSPGELPLTSSGKVDLPRLAAVFDD